MASRALHSQGASTSGRPPLIAPQQHRHTVRPLLAGKPWQAAPRQLAPRRPALLMQAALSHSSSSGGLLGHGHDQQPKRELMMPAISSADHIGSEHGEGFMQFRISGDHTHLDVDMLNEQLRSAGAMRMRHAMRPDEAFGLIICFDNVIADTRGLQCAAWHQVAKAEGLCFPSIERPAMYELRPERAITEILQWTRNWKRAQELAWLVTVAYGEQLAKLSQALPGVEKWLSLMAKTHVPCALVTTLDHTTTLTALDRMGLKGYFSATVTADDDMETISQHFLSAAIKLHRPPEQCVVFGSEAAIAVAAHNCTMRAVAVMGTQPAFRLGNADLVCANMADLSVCNIRRLFSNKGDQLMDLRRVPGHDIKPERSSRRLTHAVAEPETPGP